MEGGTILETIPQPPRTVTVLEVSSDESDHSALAEIFSHSNWKLHVSRSCAEAVSFLAKKPIPVVVCERELPDGTWKDIQDRLGRAANPPALIVSCRLADDRLWAEVLERGGFNVLSKPFRKSEVFRDVSLAWLDWKSRVERMHAGPAHPRVLGGAA